MATRLESEQRLASGSKGAATPVQLGNCSREIPRPIFGQASRYSTEKYEEPREVIITGFKIYNTQGRDGIPGTQAAPTTISTRDPEDGSHMQLRLEVHTYETTAPH